MEDYKGSEIKRRGWRAAQWPRVHAALTEDPG